MPSGKEKTINLLVVFAILLGFSYISLNSYSSNVTTNTRSDLIPDLKYADTFNRQKTSVPTQTTFSPSIRTAIKETEESDLTVNVISSNISHLKGKEDAEYSSKISFDEGLSPQIQKLLQKAKEELYFDPKNIKDRDSMNLSILDTLAIHAPVYEAGEQEDKQQLSHRSTGQ